MARYIDADTLLKRLCDEDPSHMEDYYYNAIINAPTADVVEVVRCKDCKNYDNCNSNRYCNYFREVVGSYHFCSYGERRTE